ncbi:unnamed protein product [Mytilus edulis]|uniref:WSC domain-containing protein n=1 Tax=Mytilus edulis TaxID=6550 RepID=A0A8S3RU76_MYTED|nr:unnamed protein product [Mytilus edulis]
MLNAKSNLYVNDLSLAKCKSICKGFKYLGLQYTRACFCGNTMDTVKFPRVPESECNMPCSKEKSRMCGGGRQQADLRGLSSDQCYGPSTNSLWQAPHNINDEGCSTVRVDRNGCVDTMTPPVRRVTNAVAGNGNYSENSYPTFNINDNTVNNCVPQINEPSVHFKKKKQLRLTEQVVGKTF